uniref:Uncharacterized protein n=1 Tax=Setaria digitata TaxID=48799 RepID=A0A915Q199_9BILA
MPARTASAETPDIFRQKDYFSGRTEYQSMEEMRRRARVERTFLRHSSRGSQATMNNNLSGRREYTTCYRNPSSLTSSRIFCRPQTCLRKWFTRRLRDASSSSTTSQPIGTMKPVDKPELTDCTSPQSTSPPVSFADASNGTSKFERPKTSYDNSTEQAETADNDGDNNDNTDSSIIEFTAFYFP